MHRTAVRADGCLPLGDAAQRLGFRPGTLVNVIVTSAGSLLLAIDDTPVLELKTPALPVKSSRLALWEARR
jgi:hypothetical protein